MRDKKKKLALLRKRLEEYDCLTLEQGWSDNRYCVIYNGDFLYPPCVLQARERIVIYDLKERKFYNSDKFNPVDFGKVKKIINEIWK